MTAAPALNRPVLRYHGGKWKLAPWIIQIMPPHETYVEAFAGAASVLMRKPRAGAEVYNDLDDEVVNIFRLLREPTTAAALRERLLMTPFARSELVQAYEAPTDAIDAACKMIVRSFMGFGSASMTREHITGFRSSSGRSPGRRGSTPAIDWATWPDVIPAFTDRLRSVVIECRDAVAVMAQHDRTTTLHYVDPPYLPETRSSLLQKNRNRGHYYRHDMGDADHLRLLEFLPTLTGMVMLSAYPSPLYAQRLAGWTRLQKKHHADGGRARTEVVWMNPACAEARSQINLWEEGT